MCLEQRGQWASARMRRGSDSSVEEEELPPEPEEEDSHLRRSWRRRCGGGVDGAHAEAPLSSPSLLCFCVVASLERDSKT